MKLKDSVQAWLNGSLADPVVHLLEDNSALTKTQLETFLIDVLAENLSGKQLNYDDKAKLRLTKAQISRGAFNRTLRQAKDNVVKSIYTILLLGYLGVFEDTKLTPYLEIANKLHDYVDACKTSLNNTDEMRNHLKVMEIIREELQTSLEKLSSPSRQHL